MESRRESENESEREKGREAEREGSEAGLNLDKRRLWGRYGPILARVWEDELIFGKRCMLRWEQIELV